MRVFLDTNVLVSAFATRGLAADVFRLVISEHEFITGAVNLIELQRVLRRNFSVPLPTIRQILQLLKEQTIVPKPSRARFADLRDQDDRWVLASAVVANADVLVTGDRDLLEYCRPPIPILSPREFFRRYTRSAH